MSDDAHPPAPPRCEVDLQRVVKAKPQKVFDEDGGAPDGIPSEPGVCQQTYKNRLSFACPGCGQWGGVQAFHGPKRPDGWQIVSGTLEDPTTLTLRPSIFCTGCCGWHGFLVNGVFQLTPG